jgi:phage baseplate assembly protein W
MGIIRTETVNKSIYSDINPDNPFDKSLVENAEAVLYALTNIFGTDQDERLFNLDVTANLNDLLFEPISDDITSLIYARVVNAILRFEPRVRLNNQNSWVIPNYDANEYIAYFEFTIIGLQGTYNQGFRLPKVGG